MSADLLKYIPLGLGNFSDLAQLPGGQEESNPPPSFSPMCVWSPRFCLQTNPLLHIEHIEAECCMRITWYTMPKQENFVLYACPSGAMRLIRRSGDAFGSMAAELVGVADIGGHPVRSHLRHNICRHHVRPRTYSNPDLPHARCHTTRHRASDTQDCVTSPTRREQPNVRWCRLPPRLPRSGALPGYRLVCGHSRPAHRAELSLHLQ